MTIIKQCQERGMVKGEQVMTDSTLFQANASLDSLVPKKKASMAREKIGARIPGIQAPPIRKISNQTHISQTDPDATLAFRRGTARTLKYKAHFTADANSRVLLAAKVTTGATHESQVYLAQLDAVEKTLGHPLSEATADRAYGSGDIIHALRDKQITPYIPLFSRRSGQFLSTAEDFMMKKMTSTNVRLAII